jgi:hypothetical protein
MSDVNFQREYQRQIAERMTRDSDSQLMMRVKDVVGIKVHDRMKQEVEVTAKALLEIEGELRQVIRDSIGKMVAEEVQLVMRAMVLEAHKRMNDRAFREEIEVHVGFKDPIYVYVTEPTKRIEDRRWFEGTFEPETRYTTCKKCGWSQPL